MLTEQVADAPVPANVHVPLGVNVTVPDGVLVVPAATSVTVAVQLVACPITTADGLHATVVVVVLRLTVTFVVPLLAEWFVSPT